MRNRLFLAFTFYAILSFSQNRTGFVEQTTGSMQGYVLFAPLHSKITYLIDKCGKQVHSWKSAYHPGQSVYLLANGDLLRTANDSNKTFKGGGIIERFDWNNKLIWSYKISDSLQCQHHDICTLPNGNILVLVWEKKTKEEAIKAGRNPNLLGSSIWSEKILELKPKGKNKAQVVWEWHVWDHVVQDHDSLKSNYGDIYKNRQLIDLNFSAASESDWLHFNSIAFNKELDQILVSNRNFSEIFIIDHSTSSSEAASHLGGKYGKGGDLLYRFGNSASYRAGGPKDQILFSQHHAHWIEKGLPDEGKIMLFNNGLGRRESMYSSVGLITPPMDEKGSYGAFENSIYLDVYSENETQSAGGSFFSPNVSSAQRLSNGNTMVCSGSTGRFCEIDPLKNTVWLYINPVTRNGIVSYDSSPGQNQVFRCTFYELSYSAFKGKKLSPGLPIEKGARNYNCVKRIPLRNKEE